MDMTGYIKNEFNDEATESWLLAVDDIRTETLQVDIMEGIKVEIISWHKQEKSGMRGQISSVLDLRASTSAHRCLSDSRLTVETKHTNQERWWNSDKIQRTGAYNWREREQTASCNIPQWQIPNTLKSLRLLNVSSVYLLSFGLLMILFPSLVIKCSLIGPS